MGKNNISDLVVELENIKVQESVQNREEIIRVLGDLLYKNKYVKDSYTDAVLEREVIFPTGLQTETIGFAIPHTDVEHVIKSAVAVATLKTPVVFHAMGSPDDEIDVSIVMMLAINDKNKVIDTLTKVISVLKDQPIIEKMMDAETSEDIQTAIYEHFIHIENQKQ